MQCSHAPCGELNEKIRGSSSTSDGPCAGQAKRSEKVKIVPGWGTSPGTICAAAARTPFAPVHDRAASSPAPPALRLDASVVAAGSPTILVISTSPSASADRGLDRVGQALAQVVAHHQPVDDDRDVVLVALVEHDRLLEHPQPIVDLHAREAVRAQLLQQLSVLALAPAHDRREHHEAGPVAELHHLVDDLLGRLPTIGRPQIGQCGLPTRDHSSRR